MHDIFINYIECSNCGLVFKEKNQNSEKIIQHYEEVDPNRSVAVSKETFFSDALREIDNKRLHNMNLLDIGCGAGDFLAHAQKRGWRPYGVELSRALAKEANRQLKTENVFGGLLKEAHFPDRKFGVVTIWDTLVHSADPFEDLQECYRILDENGYIGIRVRNITFQKWMRLIYSRFVWIARAAGIKDPSVFHTFCFSKKSIEAVLQRSGFGKIQACNSPLSSGDPYRYTRVPCFTRTAKVIISLFGKLVFNWSHGRLVVGPSLLIWAQKNK